MSYNLSVNKDYSDVLLNKFKKNKKIDFDLFDWEKGVYCYEYFDKWFDSEKFNYNYCYQYLVLYCLDEFDKWFIPEKFDFEIVNVYYMYEHCSKYKHIWEPYYLLQKIL